MPQPETTRRARDVLNEVWEGAVEEGGGARRAGMSVYMYCMCMSVYVCICVSEFSKRILEDFMSMCGRVGRQTTISVSVYVCMYVTRRAPGEGGCKRGRMGVAPGVDPGAFAPPFSAKAKPVPTI